MRGFSSVSIFALVALQVTTTTGCGFGSNDVPDILRGVSAAGGRWGACPRDVAARGSPLAVSPEFDARLASRFPPGSPETRLTNALDQMGFKSIGSCEDDRTVRMSRYDRRGSGLVDVTAAVYWQADTEGKIRWTKGFVAYTSL